VTLSASQFGQGHGSRRRRFLAEDRTGTAVSTGLMPAPQATTFTPPARKSAHYGEATFLGKQPGLIDLVPTRLWVLALLFMASLAAIAGLEVLYSWTLADGLAERGTDLKSALLPLLDLGAAGSLAAWFSSLVLLAASVAAVLVYTVRRHRMDDYRGRYRIWLWGAICWFVLATAAATNLQDALREAMGILAGTPLMGDGTIWWIMPAFFMVGAVGLRLAVDMWPCRSSIASLAAAGLSYLAAVAIRLGWVAPGDAAAGLMSCVGAAMLGHVLMLLAMGLHARHVLLDAKGLLPRREEKARKPAEPNKRQEKAVARVRKTDLEVEESEEEPAEEIDPAPVAARALNSTPARPATPAAAPAARPATLAAAAPAASAESSGHDKLSKAERRALRDRLMKERLDRERKKAGNWK
jgi:hypothetical protein